MKIFGQMALVLVLTGMISTIQAADAPADGAADPTANAFGRFDRDGDARLSEEELRNGMADIYAMYDKNGDGTLDAKELPQLKDAEGKDIIDGSATRIEDLMGEVATIFGKLDSDGDGFVSSAEFVASDGTPAGAP